MSIVDPSFAPICEQRRQFINLTVPPIRYNPISPYPTYTQQQLNMRRKAEILSYSASKSNTKTNNFTKKEKYAQLVKSTGKNKSYTTIYQPNFYNETVQVPSKFNIDILVNKTQTVFDYNIIKANAVCPDINSILTPTSSSDVPGPIINLQKDTSIPLYHYFETPNVYADAPTTKSLLWSTQALNDSLCKPGIETPVFTLGILSLIDKSSYQYTVSIPVSFYLQGTNAKTNINNAICDISINTFNNNVNAANIYYNNTLVPSYNGLNVPTLNFSYMTPSVHFAINVSGGNTFTYNGPVGILQITNIDLFTYSSYVYNFKIKLDIGESSSANNNFSSLKYGLVCNPSWSTTPTLSIVGK